MNHFFPFVGDLVAVYTPKTNIAACEITSQGRHIVLALDGLKQLITLQLRGQNIEEQQESESYGDPEHTGKTFILQDTC